MADHKLPVAIIGAVPVGLAAASQHLARGGLRWSSKPERPSGSPCGSGHMFGSTTLIRWQPNAKPVAAVARRSNRRPRTAVASL